MKKIVTVVIIHGSFGNPNENWFPWLAGEVYKLGHQSLLPTFPTPEGQSLDSWMKGFKEQVGELRSDMILVGHSLAPGFILSLLEQSHESIIGTFMVSGFLGKLDLPEFDIINETFVCRDFDWDRIRSNGGEFHVYNSNNDPYVPLIKGVELAKNLGVELTVVENGGHINSGAGFNAFPELLADLKKLVDKA